MSENIDRLIARERVRENIEDSKWSKVKITEVRKCHYYHIAPQYEDNDKIRTWEKYIAPESENPKELFLNKKPDDTSNHMGMTFSDDSFATDKGVYDYQSDTSTLVKLESISNGFSKYVKLKKISDPESLLGQTVLYGEKDEKMVCG